MVIAIIGILSSVVLASLNTARRKSRDARRIADLKQLQLALELYYDANSKYPAALTAAALITPGYIPALPQDPTDLTVYPYDQISSGATYYLGASLETAGHSVLNADADNVGTNVNGVDSAGCASEVARYCYDVTHNP